MCLGNPQDGLDLKVPQVPELLWDDELAQVLARAESLQKGGDLANAHSTSQFRSVVVSEEVPTTDRPLASVPVPDCVGTIVLQPTYFEEAHYFLSGCRCINDSSFYRMAETRFAKFDFLPAFHDGLGEPGLDW